MTLDPLIDYRMSSSQSESTNTEVVCYNLQRSGQPEPDIRLNLAFSFRFKHFKPSLEKWTQTFSHFFKYFLGHVMSQ